MKIVKVVVVSRRKEFIDAVTENLAKKLHKSVSALIINPDIYPVDTVDIADLVGDYVIIDAQSLTLLELKELIRKCSECGITYYLLS